MAITGVDA